MRARTRVVAGLAAAVVVCATNAHAQITADVIYGHKDGMALVYDVFAPAAPNGAGVVRMVSGGWFSVWVDPAERMSSFEPLLAEGFTAFAVHHGSAPRFKDRDAVSDVRAALRHIWAHAPDHGVDPERLGVRGDSADGHLSLTLGLDSDGVPISASPATVPSWHRSAVSREQRQRRRGRGGGLLSTGRSATAGRSERALSGARLRSGSGGGHLTHPVCDGRRPADPADSR